MRKVLFIIGFAGVAYVLAAVYAWKALPGKIKDAENRLFGVRVTMAQVTKDQLAVSERVRAITNETLGRDKSKVEEVSALLEDPDLNHFALVYMGADWSVQRSAFLGHVSHARSLLERQVDAHAHVRSRLAEKIKALENRKRSLARRMRTTPSDERSWHVEMDDIERQLVQFRSSNTYKECIEKDMSESKHIEEKARNEDNLYKLAAEYETATVGTLVRVMSERAATLAWQADEPNRLRRGGAFFNIWPLNLIMRMTEEKNREK